MKPKPKLWDVIIVGAGPVGLSLAKGLNRKGISTLILEKKPTLSKHSKAITIWPPTQQVFDGLGILNHFEKESLCYEKLALHDADTNKTLIEFPLFQLKNETQFPRLLILPQSKTESILLDSLQNEKQATITFGATASSIKQKRNQVDLQYQHEGRTRWASGKILVGCDGGNSFVREELEIELQGKNLPQMVGLADIHLKTEKKFASPRLSNRGSIYFAFYIGDNIWRLIFLRNGKKTPEMDVNVNQAKEQLFGDYLFEKIWQSEFHLHSSTSEKFVKGTIVLAGDAAHLNSPVGGQGMNAGIIDTLSLRTAIINSLETGSNEPIHHYAIQRKRAIEKGVNKNTYRITTILFFKQGRYIKHIFRLINFFLKIPYVRKWFLLKMTLLD